MEVRDHAMEGTFHTIIVDGPEKSFQEVLDADYFRNRGSTAKYITAEYGRRNAEAPVTIGMTGDIGENPKVDPILKVDQSKRPDQGPTPTPFKHYIQPRSTHGQTERDNNQPHHLLFGM